MTADDRARLAALLAYRCATCGRTFGDVLAEAATGAPSGACDRCELGEAALVAESDDVIGGSRPAP